MTTNYQIHNGFFRKVKCNKTASKHTLISFGVLQGSVLGLFLFLVYINDISIANSKHISYSSLFTDDLATSFTFKNNNKKIKLQVVQEKLQVVQNRAIRCIFRLELYSLNHLLYPISGILPVKKRLTVLDCRNLAKSILLNKYIHLLTKEFLGSISNIRKKNQVGLSIVLHYVYLYPIYL